MQIIPIFNETNDRAGLTNDAINVAGVTATCPLFLRRIYRIRDSDNGGVYVGFSLIYPVRPIEQRAVTPIDADHIEMNAGRRISAVIYASATPADAKLPIYLPGWTK